MVEGRLSLEMTIQEIFYREFVRIMGINGARRETVVGKILKAPRDKSFHTVLCFELNSTEIQGKLSSYQFQCSTFRGEWRMMELKVKLIEEMVVVGIKKKRWVR